MSASSHTPDTADAAGAAEAAEAAEPAEATAAAAAAALQPSHPRLNPHSGSRPRLAWRPVLAVTAVIAAIHLAVATRYGWYGDEFYYVISGRHPAFGYVDQPPLTPLLARLAAAIPIDGGLLPLRVLAVAAQAGCVVLTGLLAAELGGRARAQTIAAAAIAGCPVFVAGSLLFGTTVTDQLCWAAIFVLTARALRLGTTRGWLWAGLAVGLGLENKDTVAVLVAGIALGLAVYRREVLRTRGPWLAALLAALITLPNVAWDAQHHWADLSMDKQLSNEQGGPLGSLAQLPQLLLVLGGTLLIGLWIIGIRQLHAPQQREHRWLLAVAVVAVVMFTVAGGKPYYAAPALAGLFAAGAVRIEAADTGRGRRTWPALLTVTALTSVLIFLPVLPVKAANALRPIDPDLMQTYGWPQFVTQVAAAAKTVPADVPVLTADYEEAGALTILGPAQGIDRPIYSGHNNYTFWGPPPGTPTTVLAVGLFTAAELREGWGKVTELTAYTLPDGLRNSELVGGAAVFLCQDPRGTWAQMWPRLRHYD